MDNQIRQYLSKGHIDADRGVENCAGNEALYMRLLKKFADDPHYGDFARDVEQGELEKAEQSSHSLKGVSGNLGMNGLYEAVRELNSCLKPIEPTGEPKTQWPPDAAAVAALTAAAQSEYALVLETIGGLGNRG